MKRDRKLPLTETVHYILLALREPAHGYLIMQRIEQMSEGTVPMAAGTLYGAVEHLLKAGLIERVPSEDARRKVYRATEKGRELLRRDARRMHRMLALHDEEVRG